MMFKILKLLFKQATAEEIRSVSLVMKDVTKKRDEKARKKRFKKAKATIKKRISEAALKGENECDFAGIASDNVEPLTQWLEGLGYKVMHVSRSYGSQYYYISWGDNNAD